MPAPFFFIIKKQFMPQKNDTTYNQNYPAIRVGQTAIYNGSEFPEYFGKTFLIDDDLNDDGCCIMKVGLDWINSIPVTDLILQ